jgi:hypothetical protein
LWQHVNNIQWIGSDMAWPSRSPHLTVHVKSLQVCEVKYFLRAAYSRCWKKQNKHQWLFLWYSAFHIKKKKKYRTEPLLMFCSCHVCHPNNCNYWRGSRTFRLCTCTELINACEKYVQEFFTNFYENKLNNLCM